MGVHNLDASYYDLNITIDWNWFDFHICADDPWGLSGDMPWQLHCIKLPYGSGCGDCNLNGSCDNSYHVIFQGPMTVTLRYYQTTYECSIGGGDVACYGTNIGDQCGEANSGVCEEINLITMSGINIDNLEMVQTGQTFGVGHSMYWRIRDIMKNGIEIILFGKPLLDHQLDFETAIPMLQDISPISYNSIVDPTISVPDSDYIDSIEYFFCS